MRRGDRSHVADRFPANAGQDAEGATRAMATLNVRTTDKEDMKTRTTLITGDGGRK
jgi:hypothetical protein